MKRLIDWKPMSIFRLALCVLASMVTGSILATPAWCAAPDHPNVVLIITDDQGYGDLGCHGNSMIETPNMDKLYGASIRLTDFHVCPTCAPTRSMLMTGRNNNRVGVWHTVMGRSLLRRDETTMADLFDKNGYRTCIVGKWHLGDSYPYRPSDRGFQEWTVHKGGGVGQTPDYWGNDYFDDIYDHNGEMTKYTGYCTDVFFDEAKDFIKQQSDSPFFLYVATNAPHEPLNVAPELVKPYIAKGVPEKMARFYAMITNIDENIGELMATLKSTGHERDTIVIFMTDNGTANGIVFPRKPGKTLEGWTGFNAGMRGKKGSQYDGGHRVPCFFWDPTRWPHAQDVNQLTTAADILPTLVSLCHLSGAEEIKFDGLSLTPLLDGSKADWPDRTLIVDSQRVELPVKWRKSSVMTKQWRLVDGKELYDIAADPGEANDVASKHPDVVKTLRQRYEDWWENIGKRFNEFCPIVVGSPTQPKVTLCCHDWHGEKAESSQDRLSADMPSEGIWKVDAERAGFYRFTIRERPEVAKYPLDGDHVVLTVGNFSVLRAFNSNTHEVVETISLPAGYVDISATINDSSGKIQKHGAYYVDIEFLGNNAVPGQ